jgi:hypothetical protein
MPAPVVGLWKFRGNARASKLGASEGAGNDRYDHYRDANAPRGWARTPFSWSAAIAGAIAAAAVTFIIAALGSGIGLLFSSPYSSGLSATGLTVAAAVWLVMAQAIGFATGGYLAGRLRSPAYDGVIGERTFRDAAEGFMVWAIGVVAMIALAGLIGLYTAGVTAQVASGLVSGFAFQSLRGLRRRRIDQGGSVLGRLFRRCNVPAGPGQRGRRRTATGQRRSHHGRKRSAKRAARLERRSPGRSHPHPCAQRRTRAPRRKRQGLSGGRDFSSKVRARRDGPPAVTPQRRLRTHAYARFVRRGGFESARNDLEMR